MDVVTRWKIAVPLIGLSLLMLVPALIGTFMWWSEFGVTYRVLSISICLVVVAQLAVAVSIGVGSTEGVPWWRIGLVGLAILVSCGLAALREAL